MHYRDDFLTFHWIDKKTGVDRKSIFTEHASDELDKHNKLQEFALNIIQKGKEIVISKKRKKFESHQAIGKKVWIVSFARRNKEVVIIHIAPKKR